MARKIKPLNIVYHRKTIPMKLEHYEKVGNKWKKVSEEKQMYSESKFKEFFTGKNLSDHKRFMRNIGAKEREVYTYTRMGYVPVKFTSTSPDDSQRTVRTIDLRQADKNAKRQQALFEYAEK